MEFRFSRRRMIQGVGGATLAQSVATVAAAPAPRTSPTLEGPDTPQISLSPGGGGGPVPAGLQPQAPGGPAAQGAAPGRGGRGGGAGGYGGYLAPKVES